MMSKFNVLCACGAIVALVSCGAIANAAQPSAAKMQQMGLAGAHVVSDSVAMEVRGSAIVVSTRARAIASGFSAQTEQNSISIVDGNTGIAFTEASASNRRTLLSPRTTASSAALIIVTR